MLIWALNKRYWWNVIFMLMLMMATSQHRLWFNLILLVKSIRILFMVNLVQWSLLFSLFSFISTLNAFDYGNSKSKRQGQVWRSREGGFATVQTRLKDLKRKLIQCSLLSWITLLHKRGKNLLLMYITLLHLSLFVSEALCTIFHVKMSFHSPASELIFPGWFS